MNPMTLTARTVVVSANAAAVGEAAVLLETAGLTVRTVSADAGELQVLALGRAVHMELLTPRQFQILNLVASGLSNDEIGRQIGLSGTTVKTHLSRLYRKLGCDDRATAVLAGCRLGLIEGTS